MEMVRVRGQAVTEEGLPLTGRLFTGESVSGYNLLPMKILLAEGWLPVVDIGQEQEGKAVYEIQGDRVLRHYIVEEEEND